MKKYISLAIMLNLLSGKRYSAPALAEKYETSVKTIYRCIDSLIMAGMPIVSIPGKCGGYEIIKESLTDSSFFTTKEIALMLGLLSSENLPLDENFSLSERLSALKDKNLLREVLKESGELVIDTQTWGSCDKDNSAVNVLKNAISTQERLKICYIDAKNERIIEPYTLVYKAGAWYVYAYCLKRKSFRMFKLTRIKNLTSLGEKFVRREINTLEKPWNKEFGENLESVDLSLTCEKESVNDILEWLKDGALVSEGEDVVKISGKATYSLGLIHRLMEFGDKVKVLSPAKLVSSIVEECEKIKNEYA